MDEKTRLLAAIRLAMRSGEIRPEMTPEELADALWAHGIRPPLHLRDDREDQRKRFLAYLDELDAEELMAKMETAAAELRAAGEDAHEFVVRHSAGEMTLSLEVNRDGGDWQRSLVVAIDPDGTHAAIVDEDQRQRPVEGDGIAALRAELGAYPEEDR